MRMPEIIPLTEDVLNRFDLPDTFIDELRKRGLAICKRCAQIEQELSQ
jgi:hypothetical protein